MKKDKDLYRIFPKGGVISPGKLKELVALLESIGLEHVHLGSRQDLLFEIPDLLEKTVTKDAVKLDLELVTDRSLQNIVSSYVSADIFDMTHWLTGSTYLYILEGFDFQPKLMVNLVDAKQKLVPLYSGNLNFIASETEDYWYLRINLPHWDASAFLPVLIYSWDIPKVVDQIESIQTECTDVELLFERLTGNMTINTKNSNVPFHSPIVTFPYYEGMNKMGLNQYWLGLYWRNNKYELSFLRQLSEFCLRNSIGKICITPWKSLILKGIPAESKFELECFLGKRGINVRHSQLEMNWHLPVNDVNALELKKYLVHHFDQSDISTYGLTFGISDTKGKSNHFAAVVIEMNGPFDISEEIKVRPSYNIVYANNFDANTQKYTVFALDVDKMELPGLLIELSRKYFDFLGSQMQEREQDKKLDLKFKTVHQCGECLGIYDEELGDPISEIKKGTLFTSLPETYVCGICGAPKEKFEPVELVLDIPE